MESRKIKIYGMHCSSCEVVLEKEIKEISGIKWCRASHKKNEIEIGYQGEFPEKEINEKIRNCGYHTEKNEGKHKNKPNDYLQIAMLALLVLAVINLINKLEIVKLFPDFGDKVNIAIAFLIGIVASISTCLILVGGIVMSFGSMYKTQDGKEHSLWHKALPHIHFHIGRIAGFMVLGGLLGLLGKKINYSLNFTGVLTIVVASVMLYLGLHILNIVPNITKFGFHLPKSISHKINELQKKEHPLLPGLLGVLTFFLPCGFTQSMQLAAIGSQSFLAGSLIMGFFALGTVPVLISIGIGSSFSQNRDFGLVKKIVGILVVFFGLYSLNSGFVLAGSDVNLDFWNSGKNSETAQISENSSVQTIKMDVDYTFKPSEFRIKKGIPVRWEIYGKNITGCNNRVVIPRLGISSGKLRQGLNVVEFTPQEEGILPFSCWMGMIQGKFIVTN